MNQEDQNKLFESILSDYLNNITSAERTADIPPKKSNGEWKINTGNSLKKLLLGIDASTFSGKATKATNDTKEIKEMTLNQPFKVETESGNYTLIIEGAKTTDKRNQFSQKNVTKVVLLVHLRQMMEY